MEKELVGAGGSAGGDALATVEAYDPLTNTWRSLPPMSQGRQGAVCGLVGDSLVVAGGGSLATGPLSSAEAYSPETGWTRSASAARRLVRCGVRAGRLYVAGGVNSSKLQVWDGTVGVLSDMPGLSTAAGAHTRRPVQVMGGRVLVPYETLAYDPQRDRWATAGRCRRCAPGADSRVVHGGRARRSGRALRPVGAAFRGRRLGIAMPPLTWATPRSCAARSFWAEH